MYGVSTLTKICIDSISNALFMLSVGSGGELDSHGNFAAFFLSDAWIIQGGLIFGVVYCVAVDKKLLTNCDALRENIYILVIFFTFNGPITSNRQNLFIWNSFLSIT